MTDCFLKPRSSVWKLRPDAPLELTCEGALIRWRCLNERFTVTEYILDHGEIEVRK